MNNINPIFIAGAALVVLAVLAVGYFAYQPSLPSTTNSEAIETQATSTSATSSPQAVTSATSSPKSATQPTIALSQYTVYLGSAISLGTSSESVMRQQVSKVVIGYEWETTPKNLMFDSVVLPQWDPSETGGEREYEVYVWEDGAYTLLGRHAPQKEIQFPRDGLNGPRRFKVVGIDPALLVCPGDRSFTWSMRFTYPGEVGLVRTPITQELWPWGTCHMR